MLEFKRLPRDSIPEEFAYDISLFTFYQSSRMSKSQVSISRYKVTPESQILESDPIAIEEPLQISLLQGSSETVYSLIMRTPGQDKFLAYGLLFSEAVIQSANDIIAVTHVQSEQVPQANLLTLEVSATTPLELEDKKRRYASYSGCGLCGKTSLQALELKQLKELKPIKTRLNNDLIKKLKLILAKQPLFSQTGGAHTAGLIYEKQGVLDYANSPFFEDVGRHNALDKLLGYELLTNDLQQPGILVLSGRIGFELVQKAAMAGIAVIVALGAPSNLAVQAAHQFSITLVGFAKDNSFNLYTANKEQLDLR